MEKALLQTFQDTLRCLGIRMKLEIEKRQQVLIQRKHIGQNKYLYIVCYARVSNCLFYKILLTKNL